MTGWLAALWMGMQAIAAREVRSHGRRWRVVAGFLVLIAVALSALVWIRTGTERRPQVSWEVFPALALGTTLVLSFLPPAITAGAVSGERERKTLELLLVTGASPLGLAAGKLVAALLYVLLLLAAALPAFALVHLFGGVPMGQVAASLAVAAATAAGYAAVALLLSALFRRTLLALVGAYLWVLVTTFAAPLADTAAMYLAMHQITTGTSAPEGAASLALVPLLALSFFSPIRVLAWSLSASGGPARGAWQAAPGGPLPPGGPLAAFGLSQRAAFGSPDGQPVLVHTLIIGDLLTLYWFYTGFLVAVALAGTALSLNPVKPWHRWWWRWRRQAAPAPGGADGGVGGGQRPRGRRGGG